MYLAFAADVNLFLNTMQTGVATSRQASRTISPSTLRARAAKSSFRTTISIITPAQTVNILRAAEATQHSSAVLAKKDAVWQISDDDCAAIGCVLTTHDQQLANIPSHVIASAQEKLARFLGTNGISPIARAELVIV